MKALVTGGAGFIGSHVVDALLAAGHDVLVVDDLSSGREANVDAQARLVRMDIRDPRLGALIKRERPEVISHHAAQADVRRALYDAHHDASVNLLGGINVLRSAAAHGVRKVLYASTAAVYGKPKQLPVDESHPIRPSSGYGISKYALEGYFPIFRRLSGLDYTILRYANVYGPRQDPHGAAGVVAVFAGRLVQGSACTIFGDGFQSRDFIYVGDCAALNARLLGRDGAAGTFNVGTGHATTVEELHRRIAAATGSVQPAIYGPARAGEIYQFVSDPSRLKREVGWQAETSLEEGLRRTVNFLVESLAA